MFKCVFLVSFYGEVKCSSLAIYRADFLLGVHCAKGRLTLDAL